MKKALLFCLLIAGAGLYAATLNLPSDFVAGNAGVPKGWYRNAYHSYKPFAQYECLKDQNGTILHVSKLEARDGFCLGTDTRFPAKAGDVLNIKAKVKGKGLGWFELQTFADQRKWTGIMKPRQSFKLTDQWQDLNFKMKIVDVNKQKTARIMVTMGTDRSAGAEFFITNLQAELIPAVKP